MYNIDNPTPSPRLGLQPDSKVNLTPAPSPLYFYKSLFPIFLKCPCTCMIEFKLDTLAKQKTL